MVELSHPTHNCFSGNNKMLFQRWHQQMKQNLDQKTASSGGNNSSDFPRHI